MQIRVEKGRNQKVNFVCNNAEGLRSTSQGIVRIIIVGIELIEILITQYRTRKEASKDKANNVNASYNRHSTPADYANSNCVLHPQNSANCSTRNPAANCPRGHTRTAERLFADYPRCSLRKNFFVSCTVTAKERGACCE